MSKIMNKLTIKNSGLLLASFMALFCSNSAFSVGIARPEANKLNAMGSTVKEFIEGASHEFTLYVAHACDYYNEKGANTAMSTTQLLAILPSGKFNEFEFLTKNATTGKYDLDPGTKIEDVFYTAYTDPNDPTGVAKIPVPSGPLNNLRVSTNDVFKKTTNFWQDVPAYSHHGKPRDITVNAALWSQGLLSGQYYTNLKFRATAAKLKNCVQSVQVVIPVWQICGAKDYTSYSTHPVKLGTNDFTPNFTIVRNEITNPYPAECATDLTKRLNLTVTPGASVIEKYLKETKLPGSRTPHSFTHG
jgi:hypothetical protein